MPIYTLTCPACACDSQHICGMNDVSAEIKCPACATPMRRDRHRNYSADIPAIQGDTVAGGMNYNYYDPVLGCELRGKSHRQRVMDEKGLMPFEPDSDHKHHMETVREIMKESKSGDPEARAAVYKEQKEADYKRRKKRVEKAFEKVTPALLQQ